MRHSRSWKHLLREKMLTCCCLFLILFVKNSIASSKNCMNISEISSMHQEIHLLREENNNQNLEIALLKDTVASQDKTVRQKIIEELKNLGLLNKAEDFRSLGTFQRNKRPARLLPFHFLMGKVNTTTDQPPIPRFYGPPTNCSELSLLGYTLNGYYLVKPMASDHGKGKSVETVYCSFKQPEPYSSSTVEKRIGHLNVLDGTKLEPSSTKGLDVPSPRFVHLINGFGKCAAIMFDRDSRASGNGYKLIQWVCKPNLKGMLWSWNEVTLGSRDQHLCNAHGKCAAAPNNSNSTVALIQWEHNGEESQKYYFVDLLDHPGFSLIRNEHGKCIGVPENTGRSGAEIHTRDCNVTETGQQWKWSNP